MRRRLDSLWRRDGQGNLKFGTKTQVAKRKGMPDSFWDHPILLAIYIILCGVVDFVCFQQLFDSFLLDAPLIRWTSILGFIVAFEVIPVYLGMNLRKRLQGYNINKAMLILMVAIFVLAFAIDVYLRIVFKDLVMPDLTESSSSIFGGVQTENTISSRALPYAIFASILPLLTSIGSFTISFFMASPLKAERLSLEGMRDMLADRIGQIGAVLQEYESDPDFHGRLLKDDDEKFEAMKQMIREKRDTYRDDVRQQIKEHLGSPISSNILAKTLKAVG